MLVVRNLDILNFPGVISRPVEGVQAFKHTLFAAFPRRSGQPGALLDDISYGAFQVAWKVSPPTLAKFQS